MAAIAPARQGDRENTGRSDAFHGHRACIDPCRIEFNALGHRTFPGEVRTRRISAPVAIPYAVVPFVPDSERSSRPSAMAPLPGRNRMGIHPHPAPLLPRPEFRLGVG